MNVLDSHKRIVVKPRMMMEMQNVHTIKCLVIATVLSEEWDSMEVATLMMDTTLQKQEQQRMWHSWKQLSVYLVELWLFWFALCLLEHGIFTANTRVATRELILNVMIPKWHM